MSLQIIPPQATKQEVTEHAVRYLKSLGVDYKDDLSVLENRVTPCVLVGVRAYFRDTLGQPGRNDIGFYDDAIFFLGPKVFAGVPANVDPSRYGWNEPVGKPYASLNDGLWWFRRGPHKGKTPALRQCTDEEAANLGVPREGEMEVTRMWGVGDRRNYVESGYFAIDMHSGGENGTSSWGCQTIPPLHFNDFMSTVWTYTLRHQQRAIPYVLFTGPIR